MTLQDRITNIKLYRESSSPGEIFIFVEWVNPNGIKKYKAHPDNEDGLKTAIEYARQLRDWKPIYEELDF